MDRITFPLRLDRTTLAALAHIASGEGSDVNALIAEAIRRDLYRRSRAKKADRPDERLIAPLRALLAEDFAYAQDWQELQDRLHRKGYALREAGAGLALVRATSGERVAKASDLGYSYARLLRRLKAPFPGPSHRYLAQCAPPGL